MFFCLYRATKDLPIAAPYMILSAAPDIAPRPSRLGTASQSRWIGPGESWHRGQMPTTSDPR